MALKYSFGGTTTSASPIFFIVGDGSSTEINIDFTLPPFNYDYKGNKPVAIKSVNITGATAVLNSDKVSVTITFTTAPSNDSTVSASFSFLFNGQ